MGKEPAAKSEKQDIFFKNFTNKIKTCIEEFMKKNSLPNKDAQGTLQIKVDFSFNFS
jgi:hypothetical protein